MAPQDVKVGMKFRSRCGDWSPHVWEIVEVQKSKITISTVGATFPMGRADFARMVNSRMFKIECADA
jgi:hypothetical protein